jgi:hypothetical protein
MMTAPKIISDDVLHVPHVFTFSQGTWKECICLVAAPTKPTFSQGTWKECICLMAAPTKPTFSQGTWKECICLVAAPTKPRERSGRQTGRDKTHAEQHDMFDNSRASQGTRP